MQDSYIKENITDDWVMTITPERKLNFNFADIWNYKDLILMFVRRDFVTFYKQTILGPFWFIIQPLLMTITFTVIFGNIAGIPTDGLPHMLFYMSGIICWNYFSDSLNKTSKTFIQNSNIFGKVYFPRITMPIATILFNLVTFTIQFLFLLSFILYFVSTGLHIEPNINLLLLPVVILVLAGLGMGFGILISAVTTKYKDLQFVVTFGIQLWLYATPIVYPMSEVPEKYRIFIFANPMTNVIEAFRYSLFGIGTFNLWYFLYSVIFMIILLLLGILIFNKTEKSFIDTV